MDCEVKEASTEDCVMNTEEFPSLLLLIPVLLSIVWIIFQLFYGSWLLALLITKTANLFLQDSGIYIGMYDVVQLQRREWWLFAVGSVYVDLLAGRVVFKHLHYYCRDYSIR